jgi:hypothetical protein
MERGILVPLPRGIGLTQLHALFHLSPHQTAHQDTNYELSHRIRLTLLITAVSTRAPSQQYCDASFRRSRWHTTQRFLIRSLYLWSILSPNKLKIYKMGICVVRSHVLYDYLRKRDRAIYS